MGSRASVLPNVRGAHVAEYVEPKSTAAAVVPPTVMFAMAIVANLVVIMSDAANADILYSVSIGRAKLPQGSEIIGGGVTNTIFQATLGPMFRSPGFQYNVVSADYMLVQCYYWIISVASPCYTPRKSSLLRVLARHVASPTRSLENSSRLLES